MPTFLLTFDFTYLPLYFCVYIITFTHLHLYDIFFFSSGHLCHYYCLLGSLHLQGLYSLDVIMQSFSTAKGYHKIKGVANCWNPWAPPPRGGICPCRLCRWQCKIFAGGVNFSIFTHFFGFFLTKTVEMR